MYIPVQDWQALGGVALSPTQATGPLFRFDCTAGCPLSPFPFGPPIACHKALHQAILDAISLASNAAGKLQASPRDGYTVDKFHSFFGHDPQLLVHTRTGDKESGAIVARRFRMAEDALRRRGRRGTLYRCDPCIATTTELPASAILDLHARSIPPNEVRLCPSFWRLSRFLRAGVILHEMLHLVFGPFFDHSASERRRNNAYCYEVFALIVMGQVPELLAINKCLNRPA